MPDVSELEDHLGYWLRMVSNQVSHAFAQKLAARDVSVAEWVALRLLYDRPSLAPSELAEIMGMTRGAVSKLAERLIEKALIDRGAVEEDRRFQTLSLTPRGRALTPRLAALADQNEEEFFSHLKPAERATLEAALRGIARRAGLVGAPLD